jgi:hypothetical protein
MRRERLSLPGGRFKRVMIKSEGSIQGANIEVNLEGVWQSRKARKEKRRKKVNKRKAKGIRRGGRGGRRERRERRAAARMLAALGR